jgi:hypothetical protein
VTLLDEAADAPGAEVPAAASLAPRLTSRRRAWLQTVAVLLVVVIYLLAWSSYSAAHTLDRYRRLAPGEAATRAEGRTRLLSLTRADRLTDSKGGRDAVADAGTTYVVAELELTQQQPVEYPYCSGVLLGPGGRTWQLAGTSVERAVSSCDPSAVVVGRPYRYEGIYEVPLRYADQIVGVALPDQTEAGRTPVLRPAD